MVIFISAFFSALGGRPSTDLSQSQAQESPQQDGRPSNVMQQYQPTTQLQLSKSPSNLVKRKSKPELLIHRPKLIEKQQDEKGEEGGVGVVVGEGEGKGKIILTSNSPHTHKKLNTIVHEFIWKYGGKEIYLAGSFTDWIPSIPMVPCDPCREYWKALVELDPSQPWEFKFIVDGIWRCGLDLPTVVDPQGNTNNIIRPE